MGDLMDITPEQHKLLSSALRMKILHSLSDSSMTSKQVAVLLGETPGNIHYHIQKLFDGGLLELVETREVGGILEKHYRAVAIRFHIDSDEIQPPGKRLNTITAHLSLNQKELRELSDEVMNLLERWESRLVNESTDIREEITVDFNVFRMERSDK